MIFNSLPFICFILVFLPIYFNLKGKAQLFWCLAGSYFFYGWWDWRFLSLIAFSTLVDYWVGSQLGKTKNQSIRKRLLWLSVIVNLGFLGFFKYFNFFIDSFGMLLQSLGLQPSIHTLSIILPVGISFYTFQSMSYTIDVYREKIPVERDLLKFATYISFFPQLVAGPIVRASDFLPQFDRVKKLQWERFTLGFSQMLWGFFKKVVVADSLAPFVDQCFATPGGYSSMHLMVGVVFYSFQIYCDFSGYSDIAIGLARMMGFDFPENFRTPYFSRSFSEFWSRWHISLSSWLRDYLYIPLGGNRHGTFNTYRNLMLTMLLGGLWHGASWTFVFWGFLHGMYLVVQRLGLNSWNRFTHVTNIPSVFKFGMEITMVYLLTCLAWIFFRSADFSIAVELINQIISFERFSPGSIVNKLIALKGVMLIGLLLIVELSDLKLEYRDLLMRSPVFRVVSFAILLCLIAFLGTFGSNAFIYFQF